MDDKYNIAQLEVHYNLLQIYPNQLENTSKPFLFDESTSIITQNH